jgi:dolichyl-phosphate beta-glucosyltransferase
VRRSLARALVDSHAIEPAPVTRPQLGVVVPAYDEEARIGATLERLHAYLAGQARTWAVLVVSDGSRDRTAEVVGEFCGSHAGFSFLAHPTNRGKGHAVRTGMLQLQADHLLFSDADLATPIEEVEKLFAALGPAQVAIGSRPLKESRLEVRQPLHREMLGRTFNLAVQLLAVPGIHDTQCGFKLFTAEAAQAVFSRCRLDGFSFDIEALLVAKDLGYEIAEVPVVWRHQEGSKVVLMRDGPRMLRDLVKLRLRGRRGRLEARPAP